ncbi:MAG TPA: hypothetical protein VI078_08400 [bacterium]
MRRTLLVEVVATLLLAGCMVGPAGGGYGVAVVPALPSIVVLDADPYYHHGGYYYYYQNNSWSYSRTRSGPWAELPRDRYPKEVKFKGKGGNQGQGGGQGQGDDRGQGQKKGHDKN